MSKNTLLVLHQIPFKNIRYDQVIDHSSTTVIYVGTENSLKDIPENLPCETWLVGNDDNYIANIIARIEKNNCNVSHIIGMSEYQLENAALLRETLGLPGPAMAQVLLIRDKVKMKEAVLSAGLRVPSFASLTEVIEHPSSDRWKDKGALVLKPKDGASSEDVMTFHSVDDLLASVREHCTGIKAIDEDRNYQKFEVEEFIDAEIWHIDGVVRNGELVCTVASRYVNDCLSYARGAPFGSIQMHMTEALEDFTRRSISAVGITDGAFHLEVFNDTNGWVFLEVGHRCGGANVVQSFYQKTGINLYHAHLNMQLGLPFTSDIQQNEMHYGWFVFPGHHLDNTYVQINNSLPFRNHQFIIDWSELPKGTALTKHITYQKTLVPIAGVISVPSPELGVEFLYKMFNEISVNSFN